jgi:hypothetical protein
LKVAIKFDWFVARAHETKISELDSLTFEHREMSFNPWK